MSSLNKCKRSETKMSDKKTQERTDLENWILKTQALVSYKLRNISIIQLDMLYFNWNRLVRLLLFRPVRTNLESF
jgi:hypothetical protein